MTVYYSDVNSKFKKNKYSDIVTNSIAVRLAIDNVVRTEKGERMFQPEFGAGLRQFLFSPMTESTGFSILIAIVEAIEIWEPRVEIFFERSQVIPDPINNLYNVEIHYRILDTDELDAYESIIAR